MIKRGVHPQADLANVWSVGMPDRSAKGRPLAAYDVNGNSLEIDSWSLEDNVLHVNFGIDPVAGELEYEYQVEGDDQVVVDTSGNSVSITINQYGGGGSTTPTFP